VDFNVIDGLLINPWHFPDIKEKMRIKWYGMSAGIDQESL
jgi:hypothetical protein